MESRGDTALEVSGEELAHDKWASGEGVPRVPADGVVMPESQELYTGGTLSRVETYIKNFFNNRWFRG